MDMGGWLRGLGLGQYEDKFRDSKIEVDVLADLTDGDLEKLGLPLGDRKRLLRAIATLASHEQARTEARPATAPPASPPRSSTRLDSAERRPIIVMFCDLVGSTGIAAKLDAEDWRSLVKAYLEEASKAVTGFGGHVLQKLGDGLMALFGYPHAHENDAERAVRAALAIQRALSDINAKNAGKSAPELLARIGLELGPVVVDRTGEVFGDAPNIAARVQASAEPGSVLITMNVQRQVAGLFVTEDKGAHELKGVSAPVNLFRIVRASGAGRRAGARTLTPFVGREEELGVLMRRWDRARTGEGQLVMIVGEPGLGKSRLIQEFRAKVADTPHTWAEWSASQLLQNTPLHPFAEWGRQHFGGSDVPSEDRLAELERALRLVKIDVDDTAPLLAPLLDIPLPQGREATFAPQELRGRQLAAIVSWVMAGARLQAIVLAIEDLQWADPTSIDVLRALAERGAQAPLFIVATSRPEFRPPWGVRSHHGLISLNPLDRTQVLQMVGQIASRHALSKDVVESVSARAGGVPLFVEEVTRLLLERGEQGSAQAIPLTLQQSLAARLDRLGTAREAAQIGAVLGREFAYALLREVAEIDDLQEALERLAEADILFVEGVAPQASYRFKHALIQDAAYDSLLKSRRRALHRRAAEVLRGSASPEPEAIAHHFTAAGLDDLAIEWWGKAGGQALGRSAFQEAIAHLGKAIAMTDKAEETPPRDTAPSAAASQRRLELQADYVQAVMLSQGYNTGEAKIAVDDAQKLAAGTENVAARFVAYSGVWVSSLIGGDLALARQTAETLRREAEDAAQTPNLARACAYLGLTYLVQGDLAAARAQLEEARKIHDPSWDRETRLHFGPDAGVIATAYLAVASWLLGDLGRARKLIEEAVSRAIQSEHVPTKAAAYAYRALLELVHGDTKATLPVAETLVGLSQGYGLAFYLVAGKALGSWAKARLSNREAGLREMKECMATLTDQGSKHFMPLFQARLAEIEAEMGDGALGRIDGALALASQTGEHWSDSFLHRIRGEILLKLDPANAASADEAFRTAVAIAQEQKARSFELQAALPLAKLYQSTARPAEAYAVLAPALEGFSPTPEMPEIAEAEELLAVLARWSARNGPARR